MLRGHLFVVVRLYVWGRVIVDPPRFVGVFQCSFFGQCFVIVAAGWVRVSCLPRPLASTCGGEEKCPPPPATMPIALCM